MFEPIKKFIFCLVGRDEKMARLEFEVANLRYKLFVSKQETNHAIERHNILVRRINNGEFAKKVAQPTSTQFTKDELRSLLQLIHPDKHGGKQIAVTLTQKVNALRG